VHDRRPREPDRVVRRLVVLLALGVAALTALVATGAAEGLDERVRSAVADHDWPVPHRVLAAAVRAGDGDITAAAVLAVAALVVLLGRPWSRVLRLAVVCLGSALAVTALKAGLNRTGSYDLEETPPRPGNGAYPSGHVVAVLVVSAMAVWALSRDGGPVARTRALATGAVLGAAEAAALLLLQQHWLTDLVSGWLLGLLLVLVGTTAGRRSTARPAARPRVLRPLPQLRGTTEGST
jgi:undecaprenyl-diphosphatase